MAVVYHRRAGSSTVSGPGSIGGFENKVLARMFGGVSGIKILLEAGYEFVDDGWG
jgi:hypothetical protein